MSYKPYVAVPYLPEVDSVRNLFLLYWVHVFPIGKPLGRSSESRELCFSDVA